MEKTSRLPGRCWEGWTLGPSTSCPAGPVPRGCPRSLGGALLSVPLRPALPTPLTSARGHLVWPAGPPDERQG